MCGRGGGDDMFTPCEYLCDWGLVLVSGVVGDTVDHNNYPICKN